MTLPSAPIVIVGAGPVGIRAVQEVHRRHPATPIVIYGDEPTEPYNRVRLSGFLIGELNWQSLTRDLQLPVHPSITTRYGCAVTAIDREQRCVRDASGHVQPYSRLILATGSRPHIPDIPGIRLPGVYAFRDARDACAAGAPSCSAAGCSASKPPARCSASTRMSASSNTTAG